MPATSITFFYSDARSACHRFFEPLLPLLLLLRTLLPHCSTKMAAAASSAQLVPCVYYFAQRQLFGHLKRSCEEEIARRGNDPLAAFWRAVAVASEGNPTEAIRELDGLRRKREVEFAAMVALIDSHKRCKLVQHDVVAALEADLSAAHGRATEVALVAAAMFQWIRGDFSTARRHLSDAFRANPDSTPALCLQGWLDLTFKPKGTRDLEVIVNSVNHFSRVLERWATAATD